VKRLLMLLAAATLSAGCAGPDRPLSVGFKEVPSNVVLGTQASPAAAGPATGPSLPPGLPPLALPPPPSVVSLPPPTFQVPDPSRPLAPPVPQPTATACVFADPLAAPALEAPATVSARPAQAQYVYRNAGTFTQSGADARTGSFPALSLRGVSAALEDPDGSGFLFTVTEFGDTTVETTYLVVERQPLPTDEPPGLYAAQVTTRSSDGQQEVFDPTPDLQLAAFPLVRGARVEARGVDPRTQTVESFVSTVTGKARVDACGTPLDSFTLELTEGRLVSPTDDLTFNATYQVGTQFGGLVLRDAVAFAGTTGGAGVSRTRTSTINQVPRSTPGPQP
jgi:hypothetical protein